jgi:hypothetical protein
MSCIDIRGNRAARLCIDGVWVLVKQAPAYPLNRSDVPHYSGGITACDRWAHFCRAFRESFDESPHKYVMRRRIERAQGLMLQTNLSLAQIAIECGLADQAHLNKSFRRFVGECPGAWRRARVAPLQ